MDFLAYNLDKDFKIIPYQVQKAVKIIIKKWLISISGIKIGHIYLFTVKYLNSYPKYLFLYVIICFFTTQFWIDTNFKKACQPI